MSLLLIWNICINADISITMQHARLMTHVYYYLWWLIDWLYDCIWLIAWSIVTTRVKMLMSMLMMMNQRRGHTMVNSFERQPKPCFLLLLWFLDSFNWKSTCCRCCSYYHYYYYYPQYCRIVVALLKIISKLKTLRTTLTCNKRRRRAIRCTQTICRQYLHLSYGVHEVATHCPTKSVIINCRDLCVCSS